VSDHPLTERARTSRVPVAALIGFSIEPLAEGQATDGSKPALNTRRAD
jgi:hypothetical protein